MSVLSQGEQMFHHFTSSRYSFISLVCIAPVFQLHINTLLMSADTAKMSFFLGGGALKKQKGIFFLLRLFRS